MAWLKQLGTLDPIEPIFPDKVHTLSLVFLSDSQTMLSRALLFLRNILDVSLVVGSEFQKFKKFAACKL